MKINIQSTPGCNILVDIPIPIDNPLQVHRLICIFSRLLSSIQRYTHGSLNQEPSYGLPTTNRQQKMGMIILKIDISNLCEYSSMQSLIWASSLFYYRGSYPNILNFYYIHRLTNNLIKFKSLGANNGAYSVKSWIGLWIEEHGEAEFA